MPYSYYCPFYIILAYRFNPIILGPTTSQHITVPYTIWYRPNLSRIFCAGPHYCDDIRLRDIARCSILQCPFRILCYFTLITRAALGHIIGPCVIYVLGTPLYLRLYGTVPHVHISQVFSKAQVSDISCNNPTYLILSRHFILFYLVSCCLALYYYFFYTVFSCSVLHYSVVSYDILLPPTLPHLIMSHYLLYYPILYHLYYIILPSTYHAVYRPVLILYFLLILSRAARSLQSGIAPHRPILAHMAGMCIGYLAHIK